MLEKFRVAKQSEIDELRQLAQKGALPAPYEGFRPSFHQALLQKAKSRGLAVISEYKRASPSKGDINLKLGPEDVGKAYARGGAAALSVLTESVYFKGELDYLSRLQPLGLPLLRKDFIFDELQVTATAATPASAMLLIVRMLEEAHLKALLEQATQAGLDSVVEIFDEADLDKARAVGARIIQVNNRDLDTLTTDMETSARLIASKQVGELWISASGISHPPELARVRELGYEAALIGSSLMANDDPGEALNALIVGALGE